MEFHFVTNEIPVSELEILNKVLVFFNDPTKYSYKWVFTSEESHFLKLEFETIEVFLASLKQSYAKIQMIISWFSQLDQNPLIENFSNNQKHSNASKGNEGPRLVVKIKTNMPKLMSQYFHTTSVFCKALGYKVAYEEVYDGFIIFFQDKDDLDLLNIPLMEINTTLKLLN